MRRLFALALSSSLLACGADGSESAPAPTPAPRTETPNLEPPLPAPLDLARFEPSDDPLATEPERPRDGPWVLLWPNGQLAMTGTLRRGRRHGSFTFHRMSGSVFETGRYRDGHPVGEWTSHHSNGSIVRATLSGGYCTTRSVLRDAPQERFWCGNALMDGVADPSLEDDASELRRCIDHAREWLREHLRSPEGNRHRAASQLAMSSDTPIALRVLRDVVGEALDEIESDPSALGIVFQGLVALQIARDVELRHHALAVYERAPASSSAPANVTVTLDAIALGRPAFAEHYLAATVRRADGDVFETGRLVHVGRILARHWEPERRVALWRGIERYMRQRRETSGEPAHARDGSVVVELSRACRDTGRPQHAIEQLERAIEIFEATECARCLEQIPPELIALTA